jgi:hypothetical protein
MGGRMAVDEEARHELYTELRQLLGPQHSRTLMEHLPPTGWADVATRRDLDAAVATLRLDVEATRHEIVATLRGEMTVQTRGLIFSMLAVVFTAVSLAFTAARIG